MPIDYLKKIQLQDFNEDGYRLNPSEEVEYLIEGFYVFSTAHGKDTHLIFNDGFPVLVFLQNREDAVTVSVENEMFKVRAAWASAGSIKNVYVTYENGPQQLFIVRFHPGAFFQLFGLNAEYFRYNPIAPFENIAKSHQFNMADFFKGISIGERKEFIESYVRKYISEPNSYEALRGTLDHIHKIKGNSTVRNVIKNAGVNYKWLERSFAKNIGLLPKEYIQLHRFIHAYVDLVGSKDVDLMRIAISNGYYDSNHFLKDFKSYTGKTPLEYLRLQA